MLFNIETDFIAEALTKPVVAREFGYEIVPGEKSVTLTLFADNSPTQASQNRRITSY